MRLQKWYTERGATKGGRKMERESFIFYRSFYDSIKGLGDAEFAECMRFLCEYGLNGAEQTGGTLAEVVLKMAKPQIDANNQRRANGAKGGRPKASPSAEEQAVSDRKTDGSVCENHRLRDAKPNENGNVNGNVNENEKEKGNGEGNENASHSGQPHPFHPPSVEEVRGILRKQGLSYQSGAVHGLLHRQRLAAWQVRDEGLEGSGAKLGETGSEADGECEWILPSGERKRSEGVW